MKSFPVILFFLFLSPALFSQSGQPGNVRIIQDPDIDLLVRKHIAINENINGIPGSRIQIFFDSGTNSKTKATTVCEQFRMKYPETEIYLTFISPNYKVRVGDFRTRFDAFRFLQKILVDYPNAYVVADQIKLPKLD